MNWSGWLLLGFLSTLVLTSILSASQGLGMTRMNIPYMLGTMFTPNRDRAKLIGIFFHLINGWIFSLIYILTFELFNIATWWIGGILGLLHAMFVLTVGIPILPGIHPRMASEQQGPTVVRQLEPPGFMALHYGIRTPISVIIAHVIFGCILGGFYFLTKT
jgi:uncharacterized membrane protein YagU involved in acid resistance